MSDPGAWSTGHFDLGQRALHVLADLRGEPPPEPGPTRAVPLDWFHWLPSRAWRLFEERTFFDRPPLYDLPMAMAADLSRFSRPWGAPRVLRLGALWIAGRYEDESGATHSVFLPLMSRPARLDGGPTTGVTVGDWLRGDGEPVLLPRAPTPAAAAQVESSFRHLARWLPAWALSDGSPCPEPDPFRVDAALRRLADFAVWASAVVGLPATELVASGSPVQDYLALDHLVVVTGVGVFVDAPPPPTPRTDLSTWTEGRTAAPTAFHALYVGTRTTPDPDDRTVPVDAGPLVLADRQAAALASARTEPVTVVSGPPGTGKSHLVVAMACDALARGSSVLLAVRSDAALDALMDLFDQAPGLDPVVFGANERRLELARTLLEEALEPVSAGELAVARDRFGQALRRRDAAREDLMVLLEGEDATDDPPVQVVDAVGRFRGFVAPDADLDRAFELLHRAGRSGGWWTRHEAEGARRDLAELAGAPGASVAELRDALWAARRRRAAFAVEARGGLTLGAEWDALAAADGELRQVASDWLATECRAPDRLDLSHRAAVRGLARLLRNPRGVRRRELARMDFRVTEALPLWIGTLVDIEDLLPALPGLFDLVLFDEASSIDQLSSVGALLRARRVVVVGDPHQLRHTTFVGDEAVEAALRRHGLRDAPLGTRLDVRRNSLFDVAAGAAPVVTLDEHFRSDPHLVDFVADELYQGRLTVATRSPATEGVDCIEVVRAAGGRDGSKAVPGEVDLVVDRLRRLHALGADSVGVVSPFRAQVEAIGAAVADAFTDDELAALDLRIDTVHGFQGNERDVVVVSVGAGEGASTHLWNFVEQRPLFTVLVTRARRHQIVIVSGDPPADGLLAAYLARADAPPGRPAPDPSVSARARDLARGCTEAGLPAMAGYPTGRHVVDVVVGDASGFVGIETDVHPAGPRAHVERHLALRRAGWTLADAFASRGPGRMAELLAALGVR